MEGFRQRSAAPHEATHPAPPGAGANAPAQPGGNVHVIWGSMSESLELGDLSVGDAYRMLQAPFNIAPAVVALVNGDPVDADHMLQAGDELEFARPAGEKGSAR